MIACALRTYIAAKGLCGHFTCISSSELGPHSCLQVKPTHLSHSVFCLGLHCVNAALCCGNRPVQQSYRGIQELQKRVAKGRGCLSLERGALCILLTASCS